MDLELKGSTVFVAGSTRGIGLAIARAFLREGALTCISGRDPKRLEEILSGLKSEFGNDRVLGAVGDLADEAVIGRTLQKVNVQWGRLDILVANVGAGGGKAGWDVAAEEWHRVFETNLWASVRLARAAAPDLKISGGSIVFISSIAGVESIGAQLPYSAAKAALIATSKNLARELGRDGVRINCVAPGNVLFPGGTWEQKIQADPACVKKLLEEQVPLGRMGTPGEIADAVVFLASKRTAFITGACLIADGGQTHSYL